MNSTVSMGNSMLMSKNQSPVKFSLRNSQVVLEERSKLKAYKFYYQIGFGGFGRVWKVSHRESLRDWAMKEISKKKYLSPHAECSRRTTSTPSSTSAGSSASSTTPSSSTCAAPSRTRRTSTSSWTTCAAATCATTSATRTASPKKRYVPPLPLRLPGCQHPHRPRVHPRQQDHPQGPQA